MFPLRHETMFTEAGLPLWLRLDLVGAMRIDTDFRLEKNPGQLQRNMNMVLDIKPRFVVDKIALTCRAVEIMYQTCPTWSHFIQDKSEGNFFYLSWDKYKESC